MMISFCQYLLSTQQKHTKYPFSAVEQCVFIPLLVWVGTLLLEGYCDPNLGFFFANLNQTLLGRIVLTQPNINFSNTYFRLRRESIYKHR